MGRLLLKLPPILFIALPNLAFAQQKTAKTAPVVPADSAGTFRRTVTDLGAQAPQIDWYLMFLSLVWILIILLIGYILSRYVLQPLRVLASRDKKRAALLTKFVFTLQILIWLMMLYLMLFKVIRVSQITEAIVGATIGLALVLAARDLLANLMGGIRIALTKMLKTGDRIKLGNINGVVDKIGLTAITVQLGENQVSLIPNRLFLQEPVNELVTGDSSGVITVDFYFPAEGDFVKIREIAERAASLSKYIYLNKPITIDLENIFREGRSLVHVRLNACILDAGFEREFRSEISTQVLGEAFRQKLITPDQMRF